MWFKGLAFGVVFATALPAHAQMVPIPPTALSPGLRARITRFNPAQRAAANARILSGPAFLSADIRAADDLSQICKAIADELIGKGYDLWTGKTFTRCVALAPAHRVSLEHSSTVSARTRRTQGRDRQLISQCTGASTFLTRRVDQCQSAVEASWATDSVVVDEQSRAASLRLPSANVS